MIASKTVIGSGIVSATICIFDGSVIYFISRSDDIFVVMTNAIGAALGMGLAVAITKKYKHLLKKVFQ